MSRRIDQFLADLPRDVLGVDESIVLDPITAVLLLVGRDRGLVVDLGECPACPPSHGPMLFASRDDARIWCRQNGHSTRMPSRYPGVDGACPECDGDGLGFLLALCKHCHGHGTRAGHFEPQLLDMAISCVAEERAS